MPTSASYKLVLTLMVSLLVVGFFAFGFWRIFTDVKNSEASLTELLSGIASREEDMILARKAKRLVEEKKEAIQRINNFLVDRTNPVVFIESLEDLARKTRNSIVIDLDEAQSNATKDLVFRLTLDGTKESTLKYLELLEFLPYRISVGELSFQKLSESKGGAGARVIILIQVKTK